MARNDEAEIRELLSSKRRIAVVGASPNPARASHGVLCYLVDQGHDVIAVNPGHAGKPSAAHRLSPPLPMWSPARKSSTSSATVKMQARRWMKPSFMAQKPCGCSLA